MSLYRKYRPASFSEVVGQEQVTRPLSAALNSGRINHAYLFSGPRGCGKTSSARILARSVNCVHGPTATPCGECDSCRSLAPGGPGNLDVTELDAASHNGVEDMRELRDRAYYAPAESRYRVFIIDEAHMISNAGSNALLKIVEEPPEHLLFIFATTEPEKVIGTIRSRTHHYPFRLLTPQSMKSLLQRTVEAEGMHVDDAVYPLVIRAGGGSPRDSLSILDQLLAGAGEEGLSYEKALPLLGVTDLSLLDATVDALASYNKAELFSTIDRVIESGIEPRRFVTDLLDRLRDLMVLQAVPEALEMGLVSAPTDRGEVLKAQAAQFSANHIAKLADEVNSRMADMRGATSPRLLLEILCAHLVLIGDMPSTGRSPVETAPTRTAPKSVAKPASQPKTRPSPKPKPQSTPEPTIGLSAAELRKQWDRVVADVLEKDERTAVLLDGAAIEDVGGGTVQLTHHTAAFARLLEKRPYCDVIAAVIMKRWKQRLKISCNVGVGVGTPEAQPHHETESLPPSAETPSQRPSAPSAPDPQTSAQPTSPVEGEGEASKSSLNSADDGLPPLPPEPETEEDEMIREAHAEAGESDHRDAMAVAEELLARELGAKPL